MVRSSAPNCQKLHYTWKGKQLCFLSRSALCHQRMKSYRPPSTVKVKERILHLEILLPCGFFSRWISFDQRCLFYAIILIIIISFIKKENKKDVVLVLAQRSTLSEILPYSQLVARLLRQEDASTQDQCLARRRHASHGQVYLRCKNQNPSPTHSILWFHFPQVDHLLSYSPSSFLSLNQAQLLNLSRLLI